MKYHIAGSRAMALLLVLACCFGVAGTAEAALISSGGSFTEISSATLQEYHQNTGAARGTVASDLISRFDEGNNREFSGNSAIVKYFHNSDGDTAGIFRITALSSFGPFQGDSKTASFRELVENRLSGLLLPGTNPGSFTVVSGTGVIRFIDLEDGFFGIIADDGTHYLPDSLPEEYQVDGLKVSFTGIAGQPAANVRMWGTPLRLNSLEPCTSGSGISASGTVRYFDLEGGFYGIVADDGAHYYPLNLPAAYAADGARIRFTATEEDVATIAMWGVPVTLLSVEPLDTPAGNSPVSGVWTLVWYIADGSPRTVVPGTAVSAEFGSENRLTGTAGCNHYFAEYLVSGDTLTVGAAGRTEMYCTPDGVMEQEDTYLDLLSAAAGFRVQGDDLQVFDARGTEILHFVRGAPDAGEEKPILVEFTRTGGFAGFNDALTVYQDGTATVTRKEFTRGITLSAGELSTIRQLLQDAAFSTLLPEYPPAAPGADYFTYTVTYEGKTVTSVDTGVPESLQPLIEMLGTLVGENAPDDVAPPLH
ncbi:heat shock protein HslJ [Methanolinea mesophila]|uniref:protealysin inhibitor emfourin n=1 Tax=Methanolinea mesophila TaxID=547055 RepID=UPI001AE3D1E1|nr:protealysin inhibitor emfourin [Methanolinea mesophila]MBP1928775.1 heat shock protein HslJ [Methanolinea mesophila]